MIAKELLVKYNDWHDILCLLDRFCNSIFYDINYNVEVNKYNVNLKTIQLVGKNELVFCEYEYDATHHQLAKITNDDKVLPLLTLAEFVFDMGTETNKFYNLFPYLKITRKK